MRRIRSISISRQWNGLGDEISFVKELFDYQCNPYISDQGAADQSLVLSCELDRFTIYLSAVGQEHTTAHRSLGPFRWDDKH